MPGFEQQAWYQSAHLAPGCGSADPERQAEHRGRDKSRGPPELARGEDDVSAQVVQQTDAPRVATYCRSYTAMLFCFFPASSVMPVVSVRDLLSAEKSTVPVTIVFPSFLFVSA